MELLTNSEKQRNEMIDSIINDTEKKSSKNGCNYIGKKMVWIRKCPKCNVDISYKEERWLIRSEKRGKVCNKCYSKTFNKLKAESGFYNRLCPDCGTKIIYKSKRGYFECKKLNTVCCECVKKKFSILRKGRISNRKGCHNNENQKKRMSEIMTFRHKIYGHPMSGKFHSEETKQRFKITNGGVNNGMYGKKHTIETKLKIRETRKLRNIPHPIITKDGARRLRIKRINEISQAKYNGGQIMPSYNPSSCNFFEKINTSLNLNGIYATNGGEYCIKYLGYFIDYYDPKLNIVIEWDEPHHYNIDGTLKDKDKNRQQEIIEYLHCKFYRINQSIFNENEFIKELNEYITNK